MPENASLALLSPENIQMKTAWITGGSRGIGFGIARSLIEDGYQIAISGRNQSAVAEAVEKLDKVRKGAAWGQACDVRNLEAQQDFVGNVLTRFGSIDVLIANAGIGHFAPIDVLTPDQWRETIDVNLTGVFYSVYAALEALKKSKGYIFTISSLAGTNFFAKGSAYNASKFGLTGFTQAMMLDLRPFGIRVSTIMPGSVATEFAGNTATGEEWKIQPEDLGHMISDLLKINARTLPSKIEIRPSQTK